MHDVLRRASSLDARRSLLSLASIPSAGGAGLRGRARKRASGLLYFLTLLFVSLTHLFVVERRGEERDAAVVDEGRSHVLMATLLGSARRRSL